jgi:heme exporter protein A
MNSSDIAYDLGALPRTANVRSEASDRRFAITADGLSRRYGRNWALADVGFHLPRGATLLVAGRNGSGKSTLFRVLSTAIRADGGEAVIEGHSLSDAAGVRSVTALLSHSSCTYESLTARENLQVIARLLGLSDGDVSSALTEVGLVARADNQVGEFSAGMRKRLSIARVILQRPAVILLDEPYAQLDPPGFRLMDDMIGRWKRDGATILLSTHLVEKGAAVSDYAILLEQGRLAWSGAAAAFPLARLEAEGPAA